MYRKPRTKTATILNTATDSDAILLGDYMSLALALPAAFTGATITFQGCDTVDGTFLPVYDSDGGQVSVTVIVSTIISLTAAEADALAPIPYIRLISAGAEGADRAIKVYLK